MNDPVLIGQKRKMKCHLFSLPFLFKYKVNTEDTQEIDVLSEDDLGIFI